MDPMVPEAPLEETEHGLVPKGEGWFVMNARDAVWYDRGPRGRVMGFDADPEFEQVGVNIFVLDPGNPMSMYHWEADQEDFLVVQGEGLLIAEGEERPLRQWDFVHCPAGMSHVIVGTGAGPCVVVAVGAPSSLALDAIQRHGPDSEVDPEAGFRTVIAVHHRRAVGCDPRIKGPVVRVQIARIVLGKTLQDVPAKIELNGRTLFLCCKGCERRARQDPAKTLATVDRLKAQTR